MTQISQLVARSTISAISSNVNVGMNEVVSVFVSKYEDGLFAKKAELSAKIKAIKADLKQIDADLVLSVDPTKYDQSVPVLTMLFKLVETSVHWEPTYNIPKNMLVIDVGMIDSSIHPTRSQYTKRIYQDISVDVVTKHDEAQSQLAVLNGELMEVMGLIKLVSRKERQIRGRISEMMLAESGLADLLDSSELLSLTQIS
jgi:hypothetical protein